MVEESLVDMIVVGIDPSVVVVAVVVNSVLVVGSTVVVLVVVVDSIGCIA